MLRGLSRAGLGDVGTDERFIELAGQYGFESVDLDVLAFVRDYGAERANAILKDNLITVGAFGLPVEWRSTEEKFQEGLAVLVESAAAAAAVGCQACCTYILPSTDESSAHFMAVATKRMRVIARILGAYGIKLGLEFVGPHHLRTAWNNPFIWTVQETLDWIDAIGEPNVGLLYDAYHWYTNELTVEDILSLRAEQIVHVHLNDAKDVPVQDVLDNDRLYPGEGVIDLAGFLEALRTIGYAGPVSQEILSKSAPEQSAEELFERSKAGYDKVFGAAETVSVR
ncbi:sugar phosphate isomerase/epimerase family protein [Paenibacillus sp. GCM10023252]|uniref:sugar phosphate isomerase/epimerase family protein n=1 Tax=Paenibacillus sp. GCM10023252 TaxID=3252649 RepID=UPI00360A684D